MIVTDLCGEAVWDACFVRVQQGEGRLDFSRIMIKKG